MAATLPLTVEPEILVTSIAPDVASYSFCGLDTPSAMFLNFTAVPPSSSTTVFAAYVPWPAYLGTARYNICLAETAGRSIVSSLAPNASTPEVQDTGAADLRFVWTAPTRLREIAGINVGIDVVDVVLGDVEEVVLVDDEAVVLGDVEEGLAAPQEDRANARRPTMNGAATLRTSSVLITVASQP